MPTISVIVPNYNHALYLRQRLDTIFNQTYQDFEVIILDDCSTDNSKEIIEEYRSRPQTSHIVYNETNSGSPFKQWAKGFDLAQGKYIWIAESDDWAELNFLEELLSVLNKDSTLTFAFCESYLEYPQKSFVCPFLKKNAYFNGIDFIKKKQIFSNNIVNASAVLFQKQCLQLISNDFQNYVGSGDYIFWSSLCECGNLQYISKKLNHFRRNPDTTTSKCIATGKTFFENFRIYEYFKNKGFVSKASNYRIVDHELSQIELFKRELIQNMCYNQCRSLWEKELKIDGPVSRILLFWAQITNKYARLPFYAKIWKFFHLPNTNFREKLKQLLDQ